MSHALQKSVIPAILSYDLHQVYIPIQIIAAEYNLFSVAYSDWY